MDINLDNLVSSVNLDKPEFKLDDNNKLSNSYKSETTLNNLEQDEKIYIRNKSSKKIDKIDKKNKKLIEAPKKKPGRPRLTPIREPCPRVGIVNSPNDIDNHIEFIYDNPLIFKKLWQYFKLMAVGKLQLIFRFNEIIMWGEDHHQKSKMRIKINANMINHYYCPEELDIGIVCKNAEIIMAMIDKTYTNMIITSKLGYVEKEIRFSLKNEMEIDETHRVELIEGYTKITDEHLFQDSEYTLKWEFPGRYFKKMMSEIRLFTDNIVIRQDGPDEPLIFEYTKHDKKIKSHNIVQNHKKIKFESKLKQGETFRISFKIDYVKPVSAALLSETMIIYAHENKPLMFSVLMDNKTVELQILTKIIDERESDN